jgi:hypothetical protein
MTRPSRGHGVAWLVLGSILIAAACSGSPPTSTASQSPSIAPATQAASASASSAAASQATATLPSQSSANCVERTTFDLLMQTRDYTKLTQSQIDQLVTALTAFDYGTDTTGGKWRDQFVGALKSGNLQGAQQLAAALVAGPGFGEPKPCP